MKLLLCFGTRPEAIKLAPLVHELVKRNIAHKICVTGQHREMMDQVLDYFEIKPDHDLDLMKSNQSLNQLSSRVLFEIDRIFQAEQPSLVLVHGDTTTSAVVALAAFHRGIKVGHIEAGLRTYDKAAPYPEEVNRQLTARIADLHFAPTANAKSNLIKEQIPVEKIFLTGNTVVDALQWALQKMSSADTTEEASFLQCQMNSSKKMILVTGHRRENFGRNIEGICCALLVLCEREDVEIVYPVHLNPNVREPVHKMLSGKSNIHLIDPVSYPTMLWLMKKSAFIISDSGGIQEEAAALHKSVLVTRASSERMEGVEAGFSLLVGTKREKIVKEGVKLLENPVDLSKIENPYGDGKAAERIVKYLIEIDDQKL